MAASDGAASRLLYLLRAEIGAGILGLRLFIASVAVASAMLGIVWVLADGLTDALQQNARAMLGGDMAVTTVNQALDADRRAALAKIGTLSTVVELRTSVAAAEARATVELKAVDSSYPLYGAVGLDGAASFDAAMAAESGIPGAVAEPALLERLGIGIGEPLTIGGRTFAVRGILRSEPDRLSAGNFLVGPRLLISADALTETGLAGPASLAEYRYRLRLPADADSAAALAQLRMLEPPYGWELAAPEDAGERVQRVAARTTTFLGVAGLAALATGLTGAWAAATVWIARRGRTLALYRLAGATPALVVALHATIIAIAASIGIAFGLGVATVLGYELLQAVLVRLHIPWEATQVLATSVEVVLALAVAIAGASGVALSAAARTPPAAAMRAGTVPQAPAGAHLLLGVAAIAVAVAFAISRLPVPWLAATAAIGLAIVALALGLAGSAMARWAARRDPQGFYGLVVQQGLAAPATAAIRALALGIGIACITAIVGAQSSLEQSLRGEVPARAPDLVLLDVQPAQVPALRQQIENHPELGGLQADPFMRATILEVNGVPATEALVRQDKSWVIEGDRSFSWSAGPTGAELLAGAWWPDDYVGPPLISAEEDVAQAFDLKPGDRLTYGVLGLRFTSEVASIRKEYHRTFRPEYLLVASPQPFRAAPHSWIMTLQGETDPALDGLIQDLAASAPNVTAIDVRPIITQLRQVIDGAVLGSLAVAGALLLAGALSLAALTAGEVDARRRESLALVLIGAARREIALARLLESCAIGMIAAILGGVAGFVGGAWLAEEGVRVAWHPGAWAVALPLLLGLLGAVTAGAAGGLGALPRGRGEIARNLAG